MAISHLKKSLIAIGQLVFLFLFASCTQSASMKVRSIHSDNLQHRSTKYTFKDVGFMQDIQLEILKLSDEVKSYLIFSSIKENPLYSLVCLEVDGQKTQKQARWLKGGQKLALSDTMTKQIITFLKEGKKLIISVDDFQLVVQEKKFSKAYEKSYGRKIIHSSFLEPFQR